MLSLISSTDSLQFFYRIGYLFFLANKKPNSVYHSSINLLLQVGTNQLKNKNQ